MPGLPGRGRRAGQRTSAATAIATATNDASSRIENYLGFPTGLTGAELARRATFQARKFGAVIPSVHEASHVSEPQAGGFREIGLADGQGVCASSLCR